MFFTRHNSSQPEAGPSVKLSHTVLKWLFVGFLVYVPLHIFLSQSLSLVTGGLTVWKVAKDGVLFLAGILALVVLWPKLIDKNKRLLWLMAVIAGYGLVHLLFLIFADLHQESAWLAVVYNNRLSLFLILGLAVGYTWKKSTDKVIKYFVGVTSVVAILGIIQYVLPGDLLEKAGYSLERGVWPYFYIDDKPDLPRVFSTLRDPNSLGAFLLVSSATLGSLYASGKDFVQRKKWLWLLVIQVSAIVLTFSRSAWLGLGLALTIVGASHEKVRHIFSIKKVMVGLVLVLLPVFLMFPLLKDNYAFRNIIWHSDASTTEMDSNAKHWAYMRDGAVDMVKNPIGHGPGTAGIVSIKNTGSTNLTENYYIQIGYEVGLLGLALFLTLNWMVYGFVRDSQKGHLRIALMASFWGLVVTNMLLHSWSNEAVAMAWWMLAGYQISISK